MAFLVVFMSVLPFARARVHQQHLVYLLAAQRCKSASLSRRHANWPIWN
jgi:hypothetical protein